MNKSIGINRGEVALSKAQLTVKTVLCPPILQAWPARTGALGRVRKASRSPHRLLLVIFRVGKKPSGPAELEMADATPMGFFVVAVFSGANLDPG